MEATYTAPADYTKGVAFAVARLNLSELQRLTYRLIDPERGATVADSVWAMSLDGYVNTGWIEDVAGAEWTHEVADDPEAAAIAAVATLASGYDGGRGSRLAREAYTLYHRIIGVEVEF